MEKSFRDLGYDIFTPPLWVALKGKHLSRQDLRKLVEKHVEQMKYYAREAKERRHQAARDAKREQKQAQADDQEKIPKITIGEL